MQSTNNTSNATTPSLTLDSTPSESSSEASLPRKDSISHLPSPYICSVCQLAFDIHERIPKFLPCTHVCCLTCLLKMPALKRECPICLHSLRLFSESEMRALPINQPVYLALAALSAPYHVSESAASQAMPVSVPFPSPPQQTSFFTISGAVPSLVPSSASSLAAQSIQQCTIPDRRDVLRCRAHGKRLKYYCPASSCRVLVCTFCALEQHQHGSVPVIDAALGQRAQLSSRIQQTRTFIQPISSITTHAREQSQVCERKETRMLEALDRCIGTLMQTLEDRRRGLREQISREMRTNMRAWQADETQLSEKLSFFQGSLNALEGIMEHTSDPQFLLMNTHLTLLMDGIDGESQKIIDANQTTRTEPDEEKTVQQFQARLHKVAESIDQSIASLLQVLQTKDTRNLGSPPDREIRSQKSAEGSPSTNTQSANSAKQIQANTPAPLPPSPAILSFEASDFPARSWTFDLSECAKTIALSQNMQLAAVEGHADGFVLGTEGFWSGSHAYSVRINNRGFGGIAVGVIQKTCKGKNGYSLFASYSWHSLGTLYSNSTSWSGCPSARFDTGDVLTVTVDLDSFQLTIVNQRNGQIVKQPLPNNISDLGPYYPFFYLNPGGAISLLGDRLVLGAEAVEIL